MYNFIKNVLEADSALPISLALSEPCTVWDSRFVFQATLSSSIVSRQKFSLLPICSAGFL